MEGKLRSSVPSPERSYWTGSVAAFDPDIAGRGARRRTAIAEPLPPEWQPAEAFEDLSATDRAMLDALLVEFSTSSPEVFVHGVRVASIAVSLGFSLGLRDQALGDLARGALLHDIGKMAIPASVLNKPGPLTGREMAVMRTHPQLGHDLTSVATFLRPAADIILASHERIDGTGYPNELAGERIPLGARITAVVDAFIAIMEPRAYKPPRSLASACAEMVRCAGSQFDPNVVHAWLRLLDAPSLGDHPAHGDAVARAAVPGEWTGATA